MRHPSGPPSGVQRHGDFATIHREHRCQNRKSEYNKPSILIGQSRKCKFGTDPERRPNASGKTAAKGPFYHNAKRIATHTESEEFQGTSLSVYGVQELLHEPVVDKMLQKCPESIGRHMYMYSHAFIMRNCKRQNSCPD